MIAAVPDKFQRTFNALGSKNLHLLDDLYAREIVFIDPLHRVEGLGELKKYFARLYDGVVRCQFAFDASFAAEGEAMMVWTMECEHARFRPGETLRLPGTSHIRFANGKVTYHRDYFDAGAMLYERIPVLGAIIRGIKARI